jgi:hypothetical protein
VSFLLLVAGTLFALACLTLLLPWLRTVPGLRSLPALPWQAGAVAIVIMAIDLALFAAYRTSDTVNRSAPAAAPRSVGNPALDSPGSMNSLISAADSLRADSGAPAIGGGSPMGGPADGAVKSGAGSMTAAIASLQARLAKGGGSADDWELLARSYEFLGRPDDASKARARQLPALAPDQGASAGASSGNVVSGEVSLSAALRDRPKAGAALFIIAKSVDSPGAPVAVLRTTVGSWPLKFTLDDSRSMIPGRTLTSVGRVTVEARISQDGQPLARSGDLQGSSGVIRAADHTPLNIVIDQVVP